MNTQKRLIKEEAEEALREAKEFVSVVRNILEQEGYLHRKEIL